ncbi:MAG TPA: lyase family protein, partial [Pirellulaceae bacterium]
MRVFPQVTVVGEFRKNTGNPRSGKEIESETRAGLAFRAMAHDSFVRGGSRVARAMPYNDDMPSNDQDHPLTTRYASPEMAALWSTPRRIREWRKLWIILAETQKELGLPVTTEQIEEMRSHVDDVDWKEVERLERELRHDVMAHVHAFGEVCPKARSILHWGATSCYVTDNTDLILMREGIERLIRRTVGVIDRLAEFADRHRDLPCLAFTHLQAAQPTTVGKRACLWAQDLCLDVEALEHRLSVLRARSAKGTTGTQASFLDMFQGNHELVRELDRRIAERMGFTRSFAVTGQTYPRKIDAQILDALSGVAQSAHKAATDL